LPGSLLQPRMEVQLCSHVRQNVDHRIYLTHALASVATTVKLSSDRPHAYLTLPRRIGNQTNLPRTGDPDSIPLPSHVAKRQHSGQLRGIDGLYRINGLKSYRSTHFISSSSGEFWAWFEKSSGVVTGTVHRVLRTRLPTRSHFVCSSAFRRKYEVRNRPDRQYKFILFSG